MKPTTVTKNRDFAPYVNIIENDKFIEIEWGFSIKVSKNSDGKRNSYYIPCFDIYFIGTEDERVDKAKILTKMWFDHYVVHTRKKLGALVLALHKLGFRAPNDAHTVKKFLEGKYEAAKFTGKKHTQEEFEGEEVATGKMEMAF